MQNLEICGFNERHRISESNEFRDGFPAIHLTKSSFNVSSILSYNLGSHTIVITNGANGF